MHELPELGYHEEWEAVPFLSASCLTCSCLGQIFQDLKHSGSLQSQGQVIVEVERSELPDGEKGWLVDGSDGEFCGMLPQGCKRIACSMSLLGL